MSWLIRSVCLAAIAAIAPQQAWAKPKERPDWSPALPAPPAPRPADGSIFNINAGYAPLTIGNRARMVGDPLTIVLVEEVTTSKSVGGKTARQGSMGITPPTQGPLSFLKPAMLNASAQGSFKGDGSASQTSRLNTQLAVTIAEVRSNGTALVRGEKRMMLSQGLEWVQFAGIVRLVDIDAENRIASTQVADARIEYSGKGAIQRSGRPGWLSRFFSVISPF